MPRGSGAQRRNTSTTGHSKSHFKLEASTAAQLLQAPWVNKLAVKEGVTIMLRVVDLDS